MIGTHDRQPAARAERVFAWSLGAVLVLGLVATAWVGVRGGLAVAHLASARQTLQTAEAGGNDPPAIAAALDAAQHDTSAAHALTSDPVWSWAEPLPWIGPQLRALAVSSAALDTAVSEGLAPLSSAASALSGDALRPREGAFDTAVIASLEPEAGAAATHLRAAADELSSVDAAPLLGPLRDGVARARELVGSAATASDALHRATLLLPRMLGADGQRSYLVLFQNNAEWRSLGGIVGAVAQVDTQDGRFALVDQASTSDFPIETEPVVDLPGEVRDLFDTRPARYIQNVTQVPDFTLGAPIAREMWQRLRGRTVDGVITLDPVTLGYVLKATGPVTLPTGDQLTSDNAVPLLLQEVYRRYPDPARQDEFFRTATAAVFSALAEGRADPELLLAALMRAGSEGRLMLWSADADEQAVLDGSTLQGRLPHDATDQTSFGVYLNDGTGSKMDSYLHPSVDVAWCGQDAAVLSVTLRNDAPDPASLPAYVTGGGEYGVPVGEALTGVYVVLPVEGGLEGYASTSDGVPPGFAGGTLEGRPVLKWSVQLAPGEQAHLDVRVSASWTPHLGAVVTPTIESPSIGHGAAGCARS